MSNRTILKSCHYKKEKKIVLEHANYSVCHFLFLFPLGLPSVYIEYVSDALLQAHFTLWSLSFVSFSLTSFFSTYPSLVLYHDSSTSQRRFQIHEVCFIHWRLFFSFKLLGQIKQKQNNHLLIKIGHCRNITSFILNHDMFSTVLSGSLGKRKKKNSKRVSLRGKKMEKNSYTLDGRQYGTLRICWQIIILSRNIRILWYGWVIRF